MRVENLFRLAGFGLALGALAGCGVFSGLRDAAGLTKQAPDEFAVSTKAPLIIPPDFNLRPPSPGAAPLNQTDPTSSAEIALFNTEDPQTVAARMQGNFSPAERMMLAQAGVQNADPAIRAELQSDEANMQGADESFTDRLLASPAKAPPSAKGTQSKSSGGWFDWL
ncbi:MAG: DUF3035 domain-containing protein [Rhizomicrobium sp.]